MFRWDIQATPPSLKNWSYAPLGFWKYRCNIALSKLVAVESTVTVYSPYWMAYQKLEGLAGMARIASLRYQTWSSAPLRLVVGLSR